MSSILSQSFMLPLREYKDAIKIFWPLVFGFIGLYIVALQIKSSVPVASTPSVVPEDAGRLLLIFVGFYLIGIYITLVSYGGIIKWHRKVILHEPATMLRFIPGKREWKYLGYTILFGIGMALFAVLISIVVFHLFFDGKPISQFFSTGLLNIILAQILVAFFSFTVFLLLFGKQLLRLPNVALERKTIDFSKLSPSDKKDWFYLILLNTSIVMFLYLLFFVLKHSLFSTEELLQISLSGKMFSSPLYLLISIAEIFLTIYIPLVYATLLSLYYRNKLYNQPLPE